MVPQGWSDWEAARDVIVTSREGRRHQDHGQGRGLQRPGERPQHGRLRPGDQQRRPDRQHPVDVLGLHVPPADLSRDGPDSQLRALPERRRLGPDPAAGQDAAIDTAAMKKLNDAAPDDPDDGHAGHPALVQRRLVAGQHASGPTGRPRRELVSTSRHVARLPADGGHQHAHPPQADAQAVSTHQ